MSYGSICFTHHQLKYSSPNRSTTTTKTRKRFREKEVRRMGQEHEKDKTERATGLGRRTREEI